MAGVLNKPSPPPTPKEDITAQEQWAQKLKEKYGIRKPFEDEQQPEEDTTN